MVDVRLTYAARPRFGDEATSVAALIHMFTLHAHKGHLNAHAFLSGASPQTACVRH